MRAHHRHDSASHCFFWKYNTKYGTTSSGGLTAILRVTLLFTLHQSRVVQRLAMELSVAEGQT